VYKRQSSRMSFRFEFDTTNRILRASLEGSIGDAEIADFRTAVTGMIAEGRPKASIVDLSDTTRYDISNASILAMAKSEPALPGVSIPIIIVAPAPHMFGASRVFQITSEENRPWLHVVKSLDEACELLQVKSPAFKPLPTDFEERKKVWNRSTGHH